MILGNITQNLIITEEQNLPSTCVHVFDILTGGDKQFAVENQAIIEMANIQ